MLLGETVRPIELVVFDCDGVLLDTMPAKIEAFRRWVPDAHAALREPFMAYIMGSFGRSRTKHIAYFYESLAGVPADDAFLRAEVDRFTAICEPLCAAAGWRTGAREFVRACGMAGALRHVLSGTPQAELETMLRAAGGAGLFDALHGSPPAKPEQMERILAETGTPAHRAVFIGDAEADREAAAHVGAHFVYFPSQASAPEGPLRVTITDPRELLPVETG